MRKTPPFRLLALVSFVAGCGPAPVPETPPAPAPPPPSAPHIVSPARWLYRHPETLTATVSRKLPAGGGVLHASRFGERWITPEQAAPTPAIDAGVADAGAASPAVDAAPVILPEPIVAMVPVDQRWAFFAASGRAFVAATPLGAIDEVRPPPAPFRAVSAGSAAALAVTMGGDLLRTTDGGARWIPVNAAGLAPAVPYAVALRPDGVGVVMAAPRRALVTADDGAGWAPIAVPAGDPHLLDLSDEGEIWLANEAWRPERTHHLQGKPPAFVIGGSPAPAEHGLRDPDAEAYERADGRRAISGKRVLAVARPYGKQEWKIKASELDRDGEWTALSDLEGCSGVAVATFGGDFILGCVREAAKDAGAADGDAGAPAPYRMVLHRSQDAGATWAEDGEVPIWDAWGRIVPGPDGWFLVQRHCEKAPPACSQLWFRTAAGAPFAAMEGEPGTTYTHFAIDPVHRKLLALAVSGRHKTGRFYSWSLDGSAVRDTQILSAGAGDRDLWGDISVDEHGAIVIVASTNKDWFALRSTDEGAAFELERLPAKLKPRDVALAGERGLIEDEGGHLWETASSGKTWVPVNGLPRPNHQAISCTREGCVVGTERRFGWDLATEAAPAPAFGPAAEVKPPDPVPGAAPLKCTSGEAKTIPATLIEALDDLAVTGVSGERLIIPALNKAQGIDLVVVSASEKGLVARATALFDPPPDPRLVGSQTDVMMTSAGVVGSRATYPVDSSYADVWISPVSAEIAWWRPQVGKVNRARLPPLGKGHMRGTYNVGMRSAEKAELLWLTAEGVVYRPDVGVTKNLFTFSDKGSPVKVTSSVLQSARAAVRTPAGLTLLDLPPTPGVIGRFTLAQGAGSDPQAVWTLVPPASAPSVLPLQRGDEGALVVAWSGIDGGPARGFLVPVRPGDDPSAVTDLGLEALLVEHPRACGATLDPGAVRLALDLPRAVRHPVLVEGGPKPTLLRANAVVVVVPPQGQPCVSAWIAHDNKGGHMAVIPIAGPSRGWSVARTGTSPELEVRAVRCEEAAGLAIPASFGWRGF